MPHDASTSARVAFGLTRTTIRPISGPQRSTVLGMETTHRGRVESMLADARAEHDSLVARLPPALGASLPVDAQGVTEAIDYLAVEAGLSPAQRRALVSPHAVNPAVMHARVFGREPLARETVVASFVEGARVRADALAGLADEVGGETLGHEVRTLLIEHPPPAGLEGSGAEVDATLRATYAAQEQAALLIASALDGGVA